MLVCCKANFKERLQFLNLVGWMSHFLCSLLNLNYSILIMARGSVEMLFLKEQVGGRGGTLLKTDYNTALSHTGSLLSSVDPDFYRTERILI